MLTYDEIINRVSLELDIPEEVVRKTYNAYWKAIKEKIQELPLKKDLSDEEFGKLKTCFNIPSLGKLSCTRERYINIKKMFQFVKEYREKNGKCKED